MQEASSAGTEESSLFRLGSAGKAKLSRAEDPTALN